jgi:hypothetical protein
MLGGRRKKEEKKVVGVLEMFSSQAESSEILSS